MPADESIRKRDQERLRQWALKLGSSVQSKETRVTLQYLQALDVCDLLTQSATRQLSSPVRRFFVLASILWLRHFGSHALPRMNG